MCLSLSTGPAPAWCAPPGQTYVNNANSALSKYPELAGLGIQDLNRAVGAHKVPADIATTVRNNGGGHFNHT